MPALSFFMLRGGQRGDKAGPRIRKYRQALVVLIEGALCRSTFPRCLGFPATMSTPYPTSTLSLVICYKLLHMHQVHFEVARCAACTCM